MTYAKLMRLGEEELENLNIDRNENHSIFDIKCNEVRYFMTKSRIPQYLPRNPALSDYKFDGELANGVSFSICTFFCCINQKAYKAAVSLMDRTGRAAVIHPTGTGKSFIAFQLCIDNAEKTICWLSPSEYIFRTQQEKWQAVGGGEAENICFFTYASLMRMGETKLTAAPSVSSDATFPPNNSHAISRRLSK